MEIVPGVGVAEIRLGESRAAIQEKLGTPWSTQPGSAFYANPALVLRFSEDDTAELIEIPYSGNGNEVWWEGIQLTYRPMHDVIEELGEKGVVGRPSDIGFDFPEGFAVWSMNSLDAAEIGVSVPSGDERPVAEGESVGAPEYFGF